MDEEEESVSDEQPSSPIVSPKRSGQKQAKKTSITPVLSKSNRRLKSLLLFILSMNDLKRCLSLCFYSFIWIVFNFAEKKAAVKEEETNEAVSERLVLQSVSMSRFLVLCLV